MSQAPTCKLYETSVYRNENHSFTISAIENIDLSYELLENSQPSYFTIYISPFLFFFYCVLLGFMSRYHSINHLRSPCEKALTLCFLLRPFSHVSQHLFVFSLDEIKATKPLSLKAVLLIRYIILEK